MHVHWVYRADMVCFDQWTSKAYVHSIYPLWALTTLLPCSGMRIELIGLLLCKWTINPVSKDWCPVWVYCPWEYHPWLAWRHMKYLHFTFCVCTWSDQWLPPQRLHGVSKQTKHAVFLRSFEQSHVAFFLFSSWLEVFIKISSDIRSGNITFFFIFHWRLILGKDCVGLIDRSTSWILTFD